ncbi:EF-hand [Thozetella sp. PMI_491]|nr:EF-hand [Thozetella sp. PMI_491]
MMASSSRGPQYSVPPRDDFNKLDDQKKNRIGEAFDLFDTNKDGWVSYEEFRFVLRALGFDLPKNQTYEYLNRHALKPADWPGNEPCPPIYRQFNLSTMQAIAGTLVYHRDPKEELRRVFRLFDEDDKGLITLEDLRRVCKGIGNNIPEPDMRAMIDEFDSSGKGGVDEDEFIRLMMNKK